MRPVALILACAALVSACGSDEPKSAAPPEREARATLAGAPAPLAALHRQANQLLDGGVPAFRERLAKLEGYPTIVNKWGSWCAPCRAEFPFFQSQALKRGKKIAFLGVDVQDPEDDAREFLDEFPVSYPSYRDDDLKISADLKALANPTTVFYDSKGELAYVHQGGYPSEEKLVEDIERYAR
jgi:cytochrome c biogenesis protein CcmG, thiol:disulfide interchange protein DsbE